MRNLMTYALLCIGVTSLAQERSLTISTDREQILIGEQVQMTLVLKASASDTVNLPVISDTLITEIEVVNKAPIDTSFEGNQLEQKILTQTLVLTSFDSGYFVVEPLRARINGQIVESNTLLLYVQTFEIDTASGIMDIKPIEDVPFAWKEWIQQNWHWFAIAIALLAIITWLALYFSKQEPKKVEKPKPIITRPAHEIALERLDKLLQAELWQQGKIKEYYSELTDILREYIELRYEVPALEQTTEEIIISMRHIPDFESDQIDKIKRTLFLSDLVKFAKEKPVGSENELHFGSVKQFIIDTKPYEAPKPVNTAPDV